MKITLNHFISIFSFSIILILLIFEAFSDNSGVNIAIYFLALLILSFLGFLSFEYISFDYLNKNVIIFFIFFILIDTVIRFTILPAVLNITFYHAPLIPAIYFIILLFIYLTSGEKLKLRFPKSKTEYLLLIPFLITFAISAFIVNFKDLFTNDGFAKTVIFILSGFFCVYYLPVRMFTDKKLFHFFIIAIFSLGLISAIFGLITIAIPTINPQNLSPGQSISFYSHQNAHAFLYPFALPCGLYLFVEERKKSSVSFNWFMIMGLFIMLLSLILTFDRTGMLATIIAILVFVFFYSKKLFAGLVIIFPIIVMLLFNLTTEAKGAATVIGRLELMIVGIETFKSSNSGFLWGFGIVTNVKVFEAVKLSLSFNSEVFNNPHNAYILSILRYGLITTIFMFAYVYTNIIKAIINLIRRKMDLKLILCVSVCFSVLIYGLLEDLMLIPEVYMIHFFLIFFGSLLLNLKYGRTVRSEQLLGSVK